MKVIIIRSDSSDRHHDAYFCPPEGMAIQQATELADSLIKEVKAEFPQDYGFEDLVKKLHAAEFTRPWVGVCQEVW